MSSLLSTQMYFTLNEITLRILKEFGVTLMNCSEYADFESQVRHSVEQKLIELKPKLLDLKSTEFKQYVANSVYLELAQTIKPNIQDLQSRTHLFEKFVIFVSGSYLVYSFSNFISKK